MFEDAAKGLEMMSKYMHPLGILLIAFLFYLWRDERTERKEIQDDYKVKDQETNTALSKIADAMRAILEKLR